ncbi:peptide-N(4)-(N-acetyl-beta-glucosaminyl)asparagine amidase-like [Ornithodoros turicata]|uniref:peptide-N(4)-(N-acetyl-beta- glucosaminyl)asparagine amidase-like n=1 Tax=Ornithodoros turicata TaxID=34597 RepID=UPI00313A036C
MMENPAKLRFQIRSNLAKVKMYEQRDLQEKAAARIPVKDLTRKAQMSMLDISSQPSPATLPKPTFRDFLLLELLHWFKNSFFTWVDTLPCSQCKSETKVVGGGDPTPEDVRYMVSRVELHECPKCHTQERFPRYDHPGKLLETRRGRCGEWANCFTLCCRALSFDARLVLDWTDHVWTEVFSESQGRWVHCDSCEDLCDAPLIYEVGWGKKLSYVLAFSAYEVQDVTWRYTTDFAATLSRRVLYAESDVVDLVLSETRKLQRDIPAERKDYLLARRVQELAELLTPRKASDVDKHGRISGSLAWRQQRGETGVHFCPRVFKPRSSDCKTVVLKYSASKDLYIVSEDGTQVENIPGWQNGVFSQDKLFRKVEPDWKMVYLTRIEGEDKGTVSWKLDFSSNQAVETIAVVCKSATFENGEVRWLLCSEDSCVRLQSGDGPQIVSSLKGARILILKAELEGGKGPVAWQHAQLFREALDSDVPSLEIKVTLSEQ